MWVSLSDGTTGTDQTTWHKPSVSETKMRGWLFKDGKPCFTPKNSKCVKGANAYTVRENGHEYYYYEIPFPRANKNGYQCPNDILKKDKFYIGVWLEPSYCTGSTSVRLASMKFFSPNEKKNGKYKMYLMDKNWAADPNHCIDKGTTPMFMAYVPYYREAPTEADLTKLTHINYFSAKIVKNQEDINKYKEKGIQTSVGQVVVDTGSSSPQTVLSLKSKKSGLKVLLTIGGSGSGDSFRTLFKNKDYQKFYDCIIDYMKKSYNNQHFDGVDIDWESVDDENDRENFNTLVKTLREKFKENNLDRIISVAASSNVNKVDWKTALTYVDYVNVMSYDLNWCDYDKGEPYRYHHSALYPSLKKLTKPNDGDGNSCSVSMSGYVKCFTGIVSDDKLKETLNMGVAFYGRGTVSYCGRDKENKPKGEADYKKIVNMINSNNYHWDDAAMVPYLNNGKSTKEDFLGYENPESVNIKGQYAKLNGFGVMFWDYGQDVRDEKGNGILLNALYNGFKGKDINGVNSSKTKNDLPLYK